MNNSKLFEKVEPENAGLKKEEIEKVETELDVIFPAQYKEILQLFDGGYGEIQGFYVDFWSLNDVQMYVEDMKGLKGLVPFATDGCGVSFAFDSNDGTIYTIPMDSMEREDSRRTASSFDDFLEKIEHAALVY